MKIKTGLILILTFVCVDLIGQEALTSTHIKWRETIESPTDIGIKRTILKGATQYFDSLELNSWTLPPGNDFPFPINPKEHLIIVQRGVLDVIGYTLHQLGPGSVGLLNPGEDIFISNNSDELATFYLMSYSAKSPTGKADSLNQPRFFIWEKLGIRKTETGGITQYFDSPTMMTNRMELHVSYLDGMEQSTEPVSYEEESIFLIVGGNISLQAGDNNIQGTTGDLIYVEPNTSHTLQNISGQPCQYFALKWK